MAADAAADAAIGAHNMPPTRPTRRARRRRHKAPKRPMPHAHANRDLHLVAASTMIHDTHDAGLPDELPTPSSETDAHQTDTDTDANADANAPQDEPLHRRRIRSFVTRAGRVSTGQRRAM